jgi:hypothetical protein
VGSNPTGVANQNRRNKMEVIVVWFLSMVAMNTEIEKNKNSIDNLNAEVVMLQVENDNINRQIANHEQAIIDTAASHSAFYARQQIDNDVFEDSIEILNQRLNVLEKP